MLAKKIKKAYMYAKKGELFSHIYTNYFFLEWKFYRLYNLFSSRDRIVKNKIVFSSFYGAGYGDCPKYLAEYILQHDLPYELVWLVDKKRCKDGGGIPLRIRQVPTNSFRAMKELSTAQFWIDNCRKNFFPKKKSGQIYIQTWHGTFPLKKIEGDAAQLPEKYKSMAKRDSSVTDYMVSGCEFLTQIFQKSFWYDRQVLNCGSPRTDIFFDAAHVRSVRKKVYDYYRFLEDSKTVLYAPTFRQSGTLEPYAIDYELLRDSLQRKFGSNWNIIVRLHPNLMRLADDLRIPSFVHNGTFYSEMQELLCASDIAVTDLSSLMFDFSLLKRPVFLFCLDFAEYQSADRELYFSPGDLPFAFSESNEVLCRNIEEFNQEKYIKKLHDFWKDIGSYEAGTACEAVINVMNAVTLEREP